VTSGKKRPLSLTDIFIVKSPSPGDALALLQPTVGSLERSQQAVAAAGGGSSYRVATRPQGTAAQRSGAVRRVQ